MGKKIVLLCFPENGGSIGLEPSILYVAPKGKNVEYSPVNRKFDDTEIAYYLCSVYISGFEQFKTWAMQHDTRKIVVGGYHPTMFPEKFLNYADKIVVGPCDDFFATIEQEEVLFERSYYNTDATGNSRFVSGKVLKTQPPVHSCTRVFGEMTDGAEEPSGKSDVLVDRVYPGLLTFKNSPRYDLYDISLNRQVIPDAKPDDLAVSVNSSFGCPYACDFCCTPPMFGPKLISRPIPSLEKDVEAVRQSVIRVDPNRRRTLYCFIRDENFCLQKDFELRLKIISRLGARIYLFSSANLLTENNVRILAENNVYMVCLGLEDPDKDYKKNRKLKEGVNRLKDRGIYTYMSFIVDPVKIVGAARGEEFYAKLTDRFYEFLPEMVCGNFLMPFPGTPMWDEYYWMISESDFQHYNSKTPFLIKNRLVHDKMRYYMFKVQWDYYMSDIYNDKVRPFKGDTLSSRFAELKVEFDTMIDGIKTLRP